MRRQRIRRSGWLALATALVTGLATALAIGLASGPALGAAATEPLASGGAPVDIGWSPDPPVQGTLFVVHASATEPGPLRLSGRFAGESLHFQRQEDGRWWAVAAVPVDSAGEMSLDVAVVQPDGREVRVQHAVSVAPGRYAMERLTVAPRYAVLDEALARRTEAESARAQAVARGAHATPRLWEPGDLVRPRPGRVTSGFGNGREFNGVVQSRHMGTDLEGGVGAPVLAAARGVVALVDEFYLGGNVVYVDHGGGLSSGYLHLSEALVSAGDTVQAGQRVGSVGATGRVTGPHLHWLVRYGAITVDPLTLLDLPIP